jgi:2-dehydropantoate 2-reductase
MLARVGRLRPAHAHSRRDRIMFNRIGIVGAGAIGCVVGGMLTRAGRDVTLIDQWPEHVETMKAKGLRLGGTCGDQVVPVKALHIHEAQSIGTPFDAVFVAVKSYDTEWATHLAVSYLAAPHGVVVDFQNGINDERVAAIAGRERTLGCVITIGAGLYEAGHALRTDSGAVGFKIGELDGRDTERARELAAIMNDVAGAKVTTNLWGERWSKLATNCMANPLAGLTGLGSAEVRTEPGPRRVAIHVGAEAILVGRGCGHEVEPIYGVAAQRFVDAVEGRGSRADLERDIEAGAKFLTGGRPSMLQDVMRKRRTEVDHLNGLVSREGRRVGVKTPFNDAIVELVHSHGVGTLRPDPRNLDPIVRMLPREWQDGLA